MNRLGFLALALSAGFTVQQISAQTPQISAGGVYNAASFAQPPILAPGVVFAVFGTSLSDGTTAFAATSSLPTRLAGARLLVNGVAAPLFYASPGQINAQFPVELSGLTSASMQVDVQSASGTVTGPAIAVTVAPYSPGIFTFDQNGSGPSTIYRVSDFSKICPPGRSDCSANPAVPGEVVSIYMTGLGPVNGTWSSGQAAQSGLPTVTTPLVTMGGLPAQVLFSGLAIRSVGLYQVDVIVPGGLSPADSVPLTVSIGGKTSNQAAISIGKASASSASTPEGGPPGGTVNAINAIAIDPLNHYTLYAATSNGVFKSTNGGQQWRGFNSGLTSLNVRALLVDPVHPANVYAGTSASGVFKSTDGGMSWTPVNDGIANASISALTIDPNNPATLYAGTSGRGVYKSSDAGVSWTAVNNGLTNASVSTVVVDPSNPAIVYAGTHQGSNNDGVFKSTDGGASWTPIRNGLTRGISALAIAPSSPNILYASTNAAGTFKTTDGGASWNALNNGPATNALAVDPLNPATVYAAFGVSAFKSTDGGASWTSVNNGLPSVFVNALAIDPLYSTTIYAGTTAGVFKSVDAAATWTAATSGISNVSVSALAVNPLNSATVYAGTASGAFKSTTGGASWTAINIGVPGVLALALAIDPLNPANLYAGSYQSVFKSTDAGTSWSAANNGLLPATATYAAISDLVVDPSNPATLYVTYRAVGIFKSTNGAASWTAVNNGLGSIPVSVLAIDPHSPATLYAGSFGMPIGPITAPLLPLLLKSTNGGASWTAVMSDLVLTLAIDPINSANVYAGTADSLFKSTNGGASWIQINSGLPNINPGFPGPSVSAIIIDPLSPANVYVGTGGAGIFKSINGGGNWVSASTGLPAAASITKLAIDPRNPAVLYAGTTNAGVFKSTDGGATWRPTGVDLDGLP